MTAHYPAAEWVPWKHESPDGMPTFWAGVCKPVAVVLHIMAGYAGTARQWAQEGHYGASWHFTVDREGNVLQHLELTDAAYHAGIPAWAMKPRWKYWRGTDENVNFYTIGIEHEGFPGAPFSEAQAAASKTLCRWLAGQLGIPWERDYFPPHADIDLTNRPSDFNTPALREAHYQYLFGQEAQEEDDMTPEQEAKLNAVYEALVGRGDPEGAKRIEDWNAGGNSLLLGYTGYQGRVGTLETRMDDHIANHAAGVTGQVPEHKHEGGKVIRP